MSDDICERLVRFNEHKQCISTDLEVEAAYEITRLMEALKPFASLFLYPDDLGFEYAEDIRSDPDWDDDANDMQSEDVFVLRRDIRRARIAIRGGGADG